MMATPTKAELAYVRQVYPWIETRKETPEGKWIFTFHKDTPQNILNLFNQIKCELDFIA